MVGHQVTASSRLAGSNDLVAPTSHELKEAVRLVAEECVRLRREEAAAPKKARGSEVGPSADPSLVKRSTTGHKARPNVTAGWCLVVSLEDEVPMIPHSSASGPPTRETTAIKAVYGKGTPLSLPGGSAAPTFSTPDSGSKTSAGSGAACLGGEITELNRGASRLKSRLSSPPPVPIKRHHEASSSKEKEGPVEKRGRVAPSSDSDDDGATLTLLRRIRSARSGPSGGNGQDKTEKLHLGGAPRGTATEIADIVGVAMASSVEDVSSPAVADCTLGDAQLSFVPATAASGACLVGGEAALAVGGVESRSSDADNAQREGPAAEPELEALSLENVELVASRTFTQLAAIRSFYSSRVRDLNEELNSCSALIERSKAALAELRTDFDLY